MKYITLFLGILAIAIVSIIHFYPDKVSDFIEENFSNKEFIIALNPLLSPKKNLENIFNKYQKAKRGINQINNQIELSENDIIKYEVF